MGISRTEPSGRLILSSSDITRHSSDLLGALAQAGAHRKRRRLGSQVSGGNACHPNPGGGRFAQAKTNRPGVPGVVVVVCVKARTVFIAAALSSVTFKGQLN